MSSKAVPTTLDEKHAEGIESPDEETIVPEKGEKNEGNDVAEAKAEAAEEEEDESQYLSGVKATIVMASVTAVCFLMLLDNSILATVSQPRFCIWLTILTLE